MTEQEFSDEERAAAYEYARRQIAEANAPGVTHLDLDPSQNDGKTAALSVIPPEIADLGELTRLDLQGTQVADLAPLHAMTGLQTLHLGNTQVADLGPLHAMTELQVLYLGNTHVADLAPLQAMTGLQTLTLSNTQVADLAPLQVVTGLRELDLNNTKVADLTALQGLHNLELLFFDDTEVDDLKPLSHLHQLKRLNFNGVPISDLSPLSELANLFWLSIIETQVRDLLPLANLHKLRDGVFWFGGSSVVVRDEIHGALAEIDDEHERAKQVLQFLNGEHPEFGGPPEPYVPAKLDSPQIDPESSGPMPEIEWEKQDPYGLSFAMTGHLLALNFSASEPAPLAQQILPELREALRQLLERLRGANFGIRQELFAEAELMAQMVAADIEEIEGQAVLLWFKSINLGSFIDRDEMARSDGRHEDDLLSAEHLSSLRRVVRASAPFVREFPEARKLDEAHRERKIDSFDPDRLFSVIERAVQAFVLEADAAGVLKQAVEIGSGSGDEATRARTVAGVSENNFWTIVARAAANYGKYAALVVGSATVMVTEGALNKVGSDLADHYRLSHSAVQLLQTIPDALLRSDDRPEDVKQTLMDAKVSIRDVELPPIPSRRPLAPFEAPAPPKRP